MSKLRILLGSLSMNIEEIGNKYELDGEMRSCPHSIQLNDTIDPQRFWLYTGPIPGTDEVFKVGVYSEFTVIPPQLLIDEEAGMLWFGWDFSAAAISMSKLQIVTAYNYIDCFYGFIPLFTVNRVLIEHELGLHCMDRAGNCLREFSGDIITGLDVKDDRVNLKFFDGPPVSLDLSTGMGPIR